MRAISIILITMICLTVHGQTISAGETVKNYSSAQKHLLAISTFQFENFISENVLDQDSLMAIACRITGMPFLLPYNEGFADKTSGGEDLINTGRIAEAKQLFRNLEGENRIQILIELAIWYLHRPGTQKADLDSANVYIEKSLRLANAGKYATWENECWFLIRELSYQKGNISTAENTFNQFVSALQKKGDIEMIARAYNQIAMFLPTRDSMKLVYYQKSFELYQQLGLNDKEIEVLLNISLCDENASMILMEKHLQQVLSLMQLTNFKHVLFAQNLLAFALVNQTKYADAWKYANAAIQNMKWSGIDAVAGAFYYRAGGVYEGLGKNNEALRWFKKALIRGSTQTHMFWYKSLFFAHALFIQINKPAESLSMINAVTAKSPPITLWEKMEVLACKGQCYEKLNQRKLASVNYLALLTIANNNPLADPAGELSYTFLDISGFYVSQRDLKNARLFLKQSLVNLSDEPYANFYKYSLLFKIDSSGGNFNSSLKIHMLYKIYYDSLTAINQRKKLNELTMKYAAERKDQDIRLLVQKDIIQQDEIKRNKITKNIMIGGTILLLIVVGLLFSRFRLKQRTNAAMKKKNLSLQHLVKEKEWLLKEVHHRVKNNLHTIIGLLESQADYLENDALKAIQNSQNRIYAMSLIHQKLYQSQDIKAIDMTSYLPEFIRYLNDSYNFNAHSSIQFRLDIQSVSLGVSQAIPVALIINEAVTNCIKYAFPNHSKGVIEITMHRNLNQVTLFIADNGIGMNEAQLNLPSKSLGVRLIKGLSGDINAELKLENDNGTKITLVFKLDNFPDNTFLSDVMSNDPAYI